MLAQGDQEIRGHQMEAAIQADGVLETLRGMVAAHQEAGAVVVVVVVDVAMEVETRSHLEVEVGAAARAEEEEVQEEVEEEEGVEEGRGYSSYSPHSDFGGWRFDCLSVDI